MEKATLPGCAVIALPVKVVLPIWSSGMNLCPLRFTHRHGWRNAPSRIKWFILSGSWYISSIVQGSFPAPASHAIRRPSPFIPGIAKLKMVFPNSYPVSSLIMAGLSPKPPVARMTELALASISSPSLSFASTPAPWPFPSFSWSWPWPPWVRGSRLPRACTHAM